MSAAHALFPGTFDPPTLGHLDLTRRAIRLFPRVTVALAQHPTKTPLFPIDERIELWQECTRELPGVRIEHLEGLVIDAFRDWGCDVIVRGVRTGADFTYEAQMAATNNALHGDLDTVFLASAPRYWHISSTLVRQIASMGGDIAPLVPDPVVQAVAAKFPL